MTALEIIAATCLIAGASLSAIAGIAVLRFPDAASRVHAATKPQLLGIVLLMLGLGIRLGSVAVIGELLLIVLLQMLTAPVAAHLTVREAHRGHSLEEGPDDDDPAEPPPLTEPPEPR